MGARADADLAWRWSPAWCAVRDGDRLVISAGADELHVVDDLDEASFESVCSWQKGSGLDRLTDAAPALVDHLVLLGALSVTVGTTDRMRITIEGIQFEGIAFEGSTIEGITGAAVPDRLASMLQTPQVVVPDGVAAEGVDLVLVVRDGGSMAHLAAARAGWPEPHLLVDVANHHTVSIGPLVIPGRTACLGCLAGRLAQRWGAPPVPLQPAVIDHLAAVAALVDIQLRLVGEARSPLVNATMSWDLHTGHSQVDRLLKLPSCPTCVRPGDGRIRLPWVPQ